MWTIERDAIRAPLPAELALTANGCVIVTVDCHDRQSRALRLLQRVVAGARLPAPRGTGGANRRLRWGDRQRCVSLAPVDDDVGTVYGDRVTDLGARTT